MNWLTGIVVILVLLFVSEFVTYCRKLRQSRTFIKRLRRPTDTSLGKPDEVQESYHRALDEIHRAACNGKSR